MKNTLLPSKSLFIAVAFFGFFAFLAVNVHARFTGIATHSSSELIQEKVETGEHATQQNLPLRSLTVVERVLEIASHFLPVSH